MGWGTTAPPSPHGRRRAPRKGRRGGNKPPQHPPPPPSPEPATTPQPKRGCRHAEYVTPQVHGPNGGLVDIEVCTPSSRAPCQSTGRSTPPSHWRSQAQSRAPAPHSPPTRSPTRIEFHSPHTHSLSTDTASACSTEGSRCVTPIRMSPLF